MKKLKHLHLRPQDTLFIWLSSFIFTAEKEKWTKAEIQEVVQTVKYLDRDSAFEKLSSLIEVKNK
ncbi:hypothetical protein DJ533_14045 [Acinetobacter defluvii]|uniref:Uncharacterized protein n=1 Tax=Acinetobacter defluvii TaxID=1871111 RepID=A0A2S2FF85_9GAMM|nr:hypothetical protein [Acinetobacter defluvii]AWL29614.1 hypothetical protein DJ533_14045 [Acinetobacter defluvii]